MLEKEIENQLAAWQDPYLAKDWISARALKAIHVYPDKIVLEVVLGYPHTNAQSQLLASAAACLQSVLQGKSLRIEFKTQIDRHGGKPGVTALPAVKNIIAVGSGKGGVGKSTIALQLALALKEEGVRVGLLDADIYGPSQPAMLGTLADKPIIKDRKITPLEKAGIQSISIGNLVDANTAMVWRGPMLGKALEQLMYDTQWDQLDYLVVDLPPGTGDVQLTLCQKMPVAGAVLVTTPQEIALHDVRRAANMFQKLTIPLLGIIENMSVHHCTACGHEEHLFGQAGAVKLAEAYQCPVLGQIPLDKRLRESGDEGVAAADLAKFSEAARRIAGRIAALPKDYSVKFPKVVVEKN